jgi:hypothetical protein
MDPAPAWSIVQRGSKHGPRHGGTIAMRMELAGLLGIALVALYLWRGSWPIC